MENKSNSLNRIKRQQREKVLRFSIRKYSFGAASVAVAALMFLGARVASADSVVPNAPQSPQPNAGVVNPKDKVDSPEGVAVSTPNKVDEGNKSSENQALTEAVKSASTVDKAKLKKVVEELNALLSTKSNLDESVVSPVKDRLQKGKEALESSELAQKDIDELVELLSKDVTVVSAAKETTEAQVDKKVDNTEKPAANLASQSSPEVSASEEGQTVSAKKDALKVSVDQLQAAVLEVPEHETTKEVLEKANELLGLAQVVLENTTVSLNEVENMNKLVKRMFNSVKNATTRLTSGARDSRNGKSMGEGAQFRATTVENGRVENALINVKEFISEAKGHGTTENGNRNRTIQKTFMTAKYSEENGKKYITYDVYFQNDGKALDGSARNSFWFYPPRDILHIDGGNYPGATLFETYYERYRNNGSGGTLSHNPNNFTKVGPTYYVPSRVQDSSSERLWGDGYSLYQLDGGPNRNDQRQQMLKNLENNPDLNAIIKQNGSYPGLSYSHLLTIAPNINYAYKYHVKMRLRDNVTAEQAKSAGTMAVTVKAGLAKNATAGYVYAATGTRLVNTPDAPKDPIQGLTVTKTVGDDAGDKINPVSSGYVRHKNNGTFPAGMNWTWAGDNSPSTAQAGVFKYKSIATYKDGTSSEDKNSGSDGTVTLNVKPKKPIITTDVAHKKGLTGQQITVNVQNGVPNGSTVNLYDGTKLIGTGTTSGGTATVTVKDALPGTITAETVVTNTNGKVTSDKSAPVTPTEAPDTQAPTLEISQTSQNVAEGKQVTFRVTARDDKHVNLNVDDFTAKYGSRLVNPKAPATATYVKNTDTEKIIDFTITTTAEDINKTNTITFKATDNASPTPHKANDVTFTFNVTPADKIPPTITSLTPISNAEIDSTNPHKIVVYREEEFSVDVNLTDNSGRLNKVKVNDNALITSPSGDFEVTNGGRLDLPANGTSINFTNKSNNLGQDGNATDTNPYKVNISGHVGKNQAVNANASKNIWNRYISGYDQSNLTNNSGNNGTANNANIQIEFRKQSDKYTPTAVTGSKIDVATDGTISGYNTPETYIANRSDLPTKGTTAGTTTTYAWKDGETPTVNNGQVTRTAVVTYPDGSTDEVPVTFTVRDTVAPTITSLTPISNAEIDSTNPRKIIVYREEEFSVDVTLTDNRGQLDKIKVHNNAQAVAPSGKFEVTSGGRLDIPANGTSINFTDKTSNLGQAGNATDTNPYKVNISGHVGKNQAVNANASKNIWNRYISGYDQEGLTNNNANNGAANNANIQIEFRKQSDKYTPTAVTGSKIDVATDGTISGYNTPETYIANKSDLPTKGTTPGTRTTYAWKAGETPTVNNGQVTRTAVVTYPDGSTDEVPVTFTVRDTVPPTITSLTPISNAEIDTTNPRKIIVYREEEFSVDVNLTDNRGQLDKIKVHNNAQAVAPSGKFEVTSGGRLDIPANGTSINFTDKTSNLGQAGNATDTNPYKVNISGHVGKNQAVNANASKNIWNRYISGYDQEGLTNNNTNNGSANNANIQIEFRKQADKYTPKATNPTVNLTSNGTVPDLGSPGNYIANKSDLPLKGTTAGTTTTYAWKAGETPTVNNGQVTRTVVVTYPDGSTDEVPVTVKVVDPRTDAEKNNPTPKDQTVNVGKTPDPKGSIGNVDDLPKGTTFEYKTPVDTTTPGDKETTVVVTYPDGSKDEVPVTVKVVDPRTDAEKNNPTPKDQTVNVGKTPDPKGSIGNVDDLPKGTTFEYKTPVDTTTPGDKKTTVVVTYPDGSKDEVPVTVKVVDPRTDAEKNNPTPKDQTVNVGKTPDPKGSIGNVDDLPKGTTFEYKTPVDTTTPGDKKTTVVVTYPDGSKDEVPVTVKVVDPRTDAEKNNPTPKDQTVNVGKTPDPKGSIGNVDDLPKGTTFEYKTPVDTTTPGDKKTTVVVTYPDGSKDEVPVTVKVVDPRTDAEKNNPTPKDQTVNVGKTPDPKGSIGNVDDLPKGTTFEYKTPVDTTTPGDKKTTVVVTYPDGSKDEVPVTVKVVDPRTDAEKNNPTPKDQTVNVGKTPDPKGSIGNVDDLPKGTTFEYKTPVDTTTPGDKKTTVVVTYPDGSKDEVPVTVKVVDPRTDAEKNNPTPKDQTVNVGKTPDPKGSIGNVDDLPKGTTFEYKTPVDTTTPGDKKTTVVVTYPDGSKDEVPVTVKVVDPRTDAEKNNPTPKDQTVNVGKTPDPKGSIGNVDDLPKGTTFEYKTPVDTTTPGDKKTTVVVTYPDGSKDEVPVTVKVVDPRTDAEKNNPTPKDQTVNVGKTPDPKGSIGNVDDLPKGTTFEYKTPVDTTTPGDKKTTVVVTYPDGSKDEVPVTVKVVDPRTDAEKNNPTPKDQTVNVGKTPDPKGSIGNVDDLPKGTTFEYKTPVDTTTPGDKKTTVVVTYPDGSKDEVPVTVKVVDPRTDAEKNNPTPKDQTVNVGKTPDPKGSIGNVDDLPKGTTFEYKTPVDTTTPGDKKTTVVVTYPDGSKDEVPVTVKVVDPRTDAEKNNPTPKDQTVNVGKTPDPKGSIGNVDDLPKGTTFEYKTPVDTTTPGDKKTTVVVTYPDGSKDEVPVTVKVVDPRTDAEKNNPTPKDQTVNVGKTPDPKGSIGNVDDLPKGTTFEYKTPVDTTTPGDKKTTVVVTYPDGSKDEVPVTVKVVDPRTDAEKNNPTPKDQSVNVGKTPDPKGSIGNVDDLPKGTTFEYKTPVDTTTPGDKKTTVVVTYPDGSKDEVPVTVKVVDPRTDAEKNNPTPKDQSVNVGKTPDPKGSIGNVDDLPKGTTFEYKTPVDTTTPGDKKTTVVVTYPDGSKDEVPVTVKVVDPRTDAEKNNPTPKDQTVNVGKTPDPKGSIGNVDDLPKGTTFEYKTPVDTTTPGDKKTTVVVTYPDGSKDEVPVTVKVVDPRTDAEKNNPTPKDQTVNVGKTPDPKGSIGNVDDLPKGTTFEYKTPVDTTTPGDKKTTVVVTYPDGSKDEVPVTVKVVDPRTDAEKNNPTPKDQSVNVGKTPDPKGSIGNVDDLPKGTTFEYKTPVDTTTPGDKKTTVVVTYPDGSKDEVPVTVKVVDPRTDAEKNNPTPKDQSVNVGKTPDPKGSIGNVDDLPKGTTFEYKTPVDTTTPGDKKTTVVVTYPDGSKDEVPVTVKVVDPRTDAEKNNPTPKDQTVNVGKTPDPKGSIGNVDDLPKGTTFEYKTPVDTTTPGDKKTTVVVTYPDGSKDEVPVTVKVVDPRTDAEKNNPTPKDQTVNVGKTPDPKGSIGNVDDLPKGTTFEYKTPVDTTTPGDKKTTVVVTYPDGSKDEVPVTVKVVDPRTDAEKNNPTPKDQTVNVGKTPDPKGSIGNVDDLPKGTTFEYKTPVDTTTPGDKKTTVVVTYPDGSKDEVPVTVKVVDPRTDAEKNNPTPKDQTVNVGKTPDPKGSIGNVDDLPKGTTFEYKTPVDTTTPGDKKTTVVVTYPDGSKDEVPVTVKVVDPRTDAEKNNPTPKDQTVNVGKTPDPKGSIGNVDDLPKGTTFEYKTPVDTTTPGDKKTTVVVTYPDGSKDEVPVTVKVVDPRTDAEKNNPTPKDQTVNVGKTPDPKGSIGNVDDLPKGTTFEYKTPVDTTTPGDKKTTVVVTYPDGSKDEVPVTVKVVDPRTDAEKNNPTPKDQSVNVGETPDPKKSIGNVDDLPKGSTVEYKTPVDTATPGDKPTTVVVTYPDGSKDEVPVTVKVVDPNGPQTEKPGKIEIDRKPNGDAIVTPKKPDGKPYPPGTKVEIPGENGTTITVEIGDNGSGEVPNDKLPKKDVPGTGKVTEPNKKPSQPVDVTTPAQKTPTVDVEQDPKTGDVTITPKKPDGSTYKPGTKVEIPGKDGKPITVTIGEDGKGKVPNSDLPDGKVPGTAKITEPGQPTVEVPFETPAKVTPETPETEKPGKIEIDRKPNGDAIVTPKKPDGKPYPPGTKVEIPGENGTTITVEIGDNGSGEVPNDKLPKKDVPGTGKVTEPNKKPSQPVDVTTPAQKTPTVDVEQDPKTGDVTITPKKPDGSTYKPGTKVEIPGKDGKPITVTIGEDGKGKVPNSDLPDGKVPGTAKITEPGQPTVEVPFETPAKVTPETPETEKPGKIEIDRKPNGDAIVTPKKPDGKPYPPGTKVEIPGENGTTITVEIGDNGSGEVPNDKLPKKDVPGTGKVTEPNKKPSQPVDVTTPARKTPTVDVEQDPMTGDVTITPKKPDGSTYNPGTKVEIPGKDGKPITVTIGEDGKGRVPNSDLPDGKVPGTAKITEPGQPAVEVPFETPAKVTPTTPTPNADQVDTKTTMDNGAKTNDSQNVLPNTGTESNATLASLGLLGLLSGFGLVARKKKED